MDVIDAPERKPPLGVMPKDIWKEKRMEELSRAIHEYIKEGYIEKTLIWIEELHGLVNEQFIENQKGKAFSEKLGESFRNPHKAL